MSDDLVKRLRTEPNWMREDYPQSEAADRIEAQAARIAELEVALAGITTWVARWSDHVGSCLQRKNKTCSCGRDFNLYEACAALTGGKDD